MEGWIKLHRSLIEWEWYNEPQVFQVFLHCLLKANHKDKKWRGTVIKKGSFITSYGHLSEQTHLTIQKIRTVLGKLKVTKEIGIKTTNKYTMITVCNYKVYQGDEGESNKQVTNKQQSNNNQITTNKNVKNDKNVNKRALPHFKKWIEYRKSIKKPIEVTATYDLLVKRFNSEPLETIEWVVNHSIENNYQGLFWDKHPNQTSNLGKTRTVIRSNDYENL